MIKSKKMLSHQWKKVSRVDQKPEKKEFLCAQNPEAKTLPSPKNMKQQIPIKAVR